MIKIAHIINPVIVTESSDLFVAQPVTFETMKTAMNLAKNQVEVELFTAQYPEDRAFIPDHFRKTTNLNRSIIDLGQFKKERKLPLIKDILDRLYQSTDADYLIYTNVDIAVMPHFYLTVKSIIESGCDAFVINRRTISENNNKISDIPLMYSEIGELHPGHDCFIFKRDFYPKFELGKVCIGINWVGRVLIYNLICHSNEFREIKDSHLTFHIGNDKVWKNTDYKDYVEHNKKEVIEVLDRLDSNYSVLKTKPVLNDYIVDAPDVMTNKPIGFFKFIKKLKPNL